MSFIMAGVIFSRGLAIGILCLLVVKLYLQYRQFFAARQLLGVFVGLQAYLLIPIVTDTAWIRHLLVVPAIAIPAFFYLFCLAVFNDWDRERVKPRLWQWILTGCYLLLTYLAYCMEYGSSVAEDFPQLATGFVYASRIVRLSLLVFVFAAILKHWAQDLVEIRRRLRSLFMAIGGGYMLAILLAETVLSTSLAPLWLELINGILLMCLLLAIAIWLLILSPDGLGNTFGVRRSISNSEAIVSPVGMLSATEQKWLDALMYQMVEKKRYTQTQLSVGGLASIIDAPEHLLRRLINQHLDYRNFSDFLNHYRVAEAARRLLDTQEAHLPILTIALDVGYGSIAPFNRAFKQRYEMTPSEYRSNNKLH